LDQLLPHFFLEVLAVVLFGTHGVDQMRLAVHRVLVHHSVDHVGIAHRLQNDVAASDGAFEIDRRRIVRRRLDEPREQRRFRDVNVAGMLAEEAE
jgi:hypothetical protein